MGGPEDELDASGRARPRYRPGPTAFWTAVDWTVCLLLLAPLCVLYWWATWKLMDMYVLRGRPTASNLVSIALGYAFCWACDALQQSLNGLIGDGREALWRRCAVAHAYTVVFAFGLVNLWRGIWQLLDVGFGKTAASGAGSLVVGVLALGASRALRNVLAPPLGLTVDRLDSKFAYSPTRFRTLQAKKSLWLFLLDVTFSVVVVGSLVVFVWRGVWSLLDVYLFPESSVLSCISSLAIGYAIVLLTFALQYQAAAVSRRCRADITRILWEDFFLLIASFGGINVWRGIWMVADVYIYPDNPVLSCWITHTVGMLGSILLYAGNTILARGVDLDGEFKDGSGCIFDTLYLRQLLPSKKFQAQQSETDGAVEMVPKSKNPREDKANGGACKQTAEGDHCLVMMDGNVNKDPGQPMLSDTTVSESAA